MSFLVYIYKYNIYKTICVTKILSSILNELTDYLIVIISYI